MYLTAHKPTGQGGVGRQDSESIRESVDERTAQFEIVWRQYFPELYRRGLDWTGGHREDAEDALGQAAMIALQKIPRDLRSEEARGWLLRLVYTRCMDIHRQRRRARVVAREVDNPSLDEEIAAAEPSHESALLDGELAAMARELIRRLPVRLRTVAELHLLREMKYPEIADALAITEVNVRKRMQHARSVLREDLQSYLAGDSKVRAPREPDAGAGSPPCVEPTLLRGSRWSVAALRKYVDLHPRGWKKRWELALQLREEGALEEAAFHLRRAAGRQPRRIELWIELAATLHLLGRSGEAGEALREACLWVHDEAGRGRLRDLIETLHGPGREGDA
jgi:RNA polymerase sigma-70 factor (ECF subfamily)